MKTSLKLPAFLMLFVLAFAACKKDKKDDNTPTGPLGPNYPQALNNIVTPAIIDSLKKNGMVINSGLTPPSINGIYLFSPAYCTFDNSGDNRKGYIFDDYKLQFQNQNSTQYTVNLAYKDVQSGGDAAADNNATYIAGQNNLFTVFAQSKGATKGINYVTLDVISGQVDAGAMKNLIWSHYLVSKDADPLNMIIPVGSTRIFTDKDGSSDSQTTFSVLPKPIQTAIKSMPISGSFNK
ncbi:hypothetical protein [Mucilaginibacter sp. KACC 22063]|uniref:hypothetical protein n=1 Tax=Mucilaginibacter sp. KACC 22063 TaxID=3025666 RepID=UPI002366D912|nr:hypothetical protein [Mucilaginibacter sp. KACC 22063]WDF54931.1 hypothetical protein PQ461_18540 [Mucilaginibacter sp. KACC 22063]